MKNLKRRRIKLTWPRRIKANNKNSLKNLSLNSILRSMTCCIQVLKSPSCVKYWQRILFRLICLLFWRNLVLMNPIPLYSSRVECGKIKASSMQVLQEQLIKQMQWLLTRGYWLGLNNLPWEKVINTILLN